MSDHSMVVTTFHFSFTIRGPSYWKSNVSLLRDREYLDRINKLIEVELDQQYGSPTKQWELLKLAIRNSTLQYAAHKAKSNKNKIAIPTLCFHPPA